MTLNYKIKTPVLEVENLAVSYETRKGFVNAVRDVSFEINRGETFGLVGESGCGKSTVAYAIVNSLGRNGHIVDGKVVFQGRDLVGRSESELQELRGNDISMVFQDPMRALNPSLRVGEQISEVLTVHSKMEEDEVYIRCIDMLKRVYMPDPHLVMKRYPHQLSGGQQQRAIIAMALLNNPALLIMDEPTTALDVTVEAAVLDLIDELRHEFNTAILYITHNLGVIARVCDRIGVMYVGALVERADVEEIYSNPVHPYTQALIECVPRLGASKASSYLSPIRGRIPSPGNLPDGCVFAERCDYAGERCKIERPVIAEIGERHFVRCHKAVDESWELPKPEDWQLPIKEEKAGGNLFSVENSKGSILEVAELKTYYQQEQQSLAGLFGLSKKQFVKALDGVSFELQHGATLGVVGESGCGKSTLAKTISGLETPIGGKLDFLGIDISGAVNTRNLDLIQELQMVFQNPDSTLNPSFPVGYQIGRSLQRFQGLKSDRLREEIVSLLNAVRLDSSYYYRRPRQLSGGEKQRVAVARAIATHPKLIICDEPVSALDVSVQAAILNLLLGLQQKYSITMIFISHDLSVVRYFSDFIAVMYLGQFVEFGPAEQIYIPPYHPYTESLLAAVPIPDPAVEQKRIRLEGTVPSALNPPAGCRFHTRCPRRNMLPDGGAVCETEDPPLRKTQSGLGILCHLSLEELEKIDPVIH